MKKKNFKFNIIKNFNVVFALILLFFSSQKISAQEPYKLDLTLKLRIIEGDIKNSLITITKKGAPYKVIDPNTEKLNVELPLGFEYLFTFTKIGYVTKSLLVDTHVPDGRGESSFAKKIAEVELEKQPDDRVIGNSKPFARISYSIKKEDFSFDKDFGEKADKTKKKEVPSTNTKTKTTPPAPVKNNPVPVIEKQSENKSESILQKPLVKNKDVKVTQEDNKKITIITVNIDGTKYIYRKEEFSFTTFYYKDNISITSDTFENETK